MEKEKRIFMQGMNNMNFEKFKLKYWLKKIDKLYAMGNEGILELANDLSNEDNIIHCKYCGSLLNILKMPILIKSVKIGETYRVKCSHCKKFNVITKSCKNW